MNENMETTTPTTPAPKKGNGLVWIIVVIVFIAALAGGYFVGQQFANKEDEKETETTKKDKKKKDKEKEEEEDDEEEEKETKKDSKKDNTKPTTGSKTIICSGDYAGVGTISVSFDYSNAKQTITSGNMDMTLDLTKIAEEGQLDGVTDAQLEEVFKDMDICSSFENDNMYSSCESSLANKKMNVKLGFNVDEMLDELTDAEKTVDVDELADEIEKGLNQEDFKVTCSVR